MKQEKNDNLTVSKSQSWQMFNAISKKYDLLNHLLSWGLDILWRQRLRKFMPNRPALRLLDLATGTADVLISLVRRNSRISEAVGIDLADKMLEIGREKIKRNELGQIIKLQNGDANQLPFDEGQFDCTTMAFGIRNVEDPSNVLREMHRVLNAQGRTLILEFSLPKNKVIRAIHIFYLRTVVPVIGWIVSGQYKAYKYLNQTIEDFPYGDAFCQLLNEAGFVNVRANPLFFGVATIYQGDKG